jgi:DNA-binding NarL/FixJ family response regulator
MSDPIRVLLVDDHAVITEGLSTLLALQPSIEVVGSARDGTGAIALSGELQPDVVLMDMSMPGMSGVEATRRILADNPATRVIIVSSFADGRMVGDALAAGAIGYVLKSLGVAELADAIRAAVQGRATLSEEVLSYIGTSPATEPALTERELDVLAALSQGKTNKQIAADLSLSHGTVRIHVSHILAKLGVENRTAAARYALRHGLEVRAD